MRLTLLGHAEWTVLAVMTERGNCEVLDLLMSSGKPGERMLADLTQRMPQHGPPRNTEASKALRDRILELREPVSKGGTLRVLYFYDAGKVIVCANAVLKKSRKTPDELIDAAVEVRKRYWVASRQRKIRIETLPEADGVGNG